MKESVTYQKKARQIDAFIFDKQLLRFVLLMNKSEFYNFMKQLQPELLKEFPTYNKRVHKLNSNIFIWICMEYGLEMNIIIERIFDKFNVTMPEEKAKIVKCYGLHSSPFISK